MKNKKTFTKSDHFNGRHFFNPGIKHQHSFSDFIRWIFNRSIQPWAHAPVTGAPCPAKRVDEGEMVITYVNHMTFLIQINGINILTDPVWSKRASPFAWVGPKRKAPVGLNFKDLPPIDFVLLSHNHYDHLDLATLKLLRKHHDPEIIVPLGNERYLRSLKSKKIKEFDWWEHATLRENFRITAVPARHFSGRGLFDRNKALWSGFILEIGSNKIYFAGDTAWGDHFKEIAQQFSGIDLAILSAGAYLPFWFMQPIHLRPSQTIDAFMALNAKNVITCHMGTFQLGDDSPQEAIEELKNAIQICALDPQRIAIPFNGNVITYKFN